jgi:hypothetical protein
MDESIWLNYKEAPRQGHALNEHFATGTVQSWHEFYMG